jgi:Spy/CpxP family protein refolding chaperone
MVSNKCRAGIFATLLLGTAAMGCTKSGNAPAAAPNASAVDEGDDATADLTEHHRYHHHGGVTLFIAMSLDSLGVSQEERASVEKIRATLHTDMEPAHAAEQSLVSALADGLDANAFDAAKIDAAVAQATTSAQAVHGASADALNELHKVLTPVERAALVDKVEAHWAVWQDANADESNPKKSGDRLEALATELELSKDQVDKIRASLADGMKGVPKLDPKEIDSHLHTFGEAFRSETFDAKALTAAGDANAHLMGWGAAHLAHFVETASPVLTPEQRAKLAQTLRMHANHDPSAQASQ